MRPIIEESEDAADHEAIEVTDQHSEEKTVLMLVENKSEVENKQWHLLNGVIEAFGSLKTHESPAEVREDKTGSAFLRSGDVFSNHRSLQSSEQHSGFCQMEFQSEQQQLNTHVRNHTTTKKHQCPKCDKTFALYSLLKSHFRIHTGEKPFLCFQRCKRFSLRSDLKTHGTFGTGEKGFRCSQCGKGFVKQSYLKSHMMIHTEALDYCSQCGKGFVQKSDLKRHIMIHSGEESYYCSECGKSFSQKANLICHMRIHSVEKPFYFS